MARRLYDVPLCVVAPAAPASPTAMLLARKGYRVLLVDRATFPSDTSRPTSSIRRASPRCERWGLLDRLVATGCPPIDTYAFDFGPFTLAGAPGTADAPSRTARGAPCSTSCWSTRPPRPAPRSARASASTRSDRGRPRHRRPRARQGRRDGDRARAGRRSAPTAGTRWSPARSTRSSTTRSRRCCAATTPTGAACRWTAFETYVRPDRGVRGLRRPTTT